MDKERVIKLLEELEFSQGFIGHDCPYCYYDEESGHSDDCELKQVLDSLKKWMDNGTMTNSVVGAVL